MEKFVTQASSISIILYMELMLASLQRLIIYWGPLSVTNAKYQGGYLPLKMWNLPQWWVPVQDCLYTHLQEVHSAKCTWPLPNKPWILLATLLLLCLLTHGISRYIDQWKQANRHVLGSVMFMPLRVWLLTFWLLCTPQEANLCSCTGSSFLLVTMLFFTCQWVPWLESIVALLATPISLDAASHALR